MRPLYFALMESNDSNTVLFVLSIVTVHTRLECFGAFIVYMSTVSNVDITFGCVQFVSRKSCVYICINIYAGTRFIHAMLNQLVLK